MTPDDVARYRRWADTSWYIAPADCDPRELCDALEAARAERAAALDAWHGMGDAWAVERERAERAEANERVLVADGIKLEEALMGMQAWADHESDRADRAEETSANERQKVVNLTGELAVVNDHLADVIERAERAEAEMREADHATKYWQAKCNSQVAALARVRALCDSEAWDTTLLASEVRAAIEGP